MITKPYYFGFWSHGYDFLSWEFRIKYHPDSKTFYCENDKATFNGIKLSHEFVTILKLKYENINLIEHRDFIRVIQEFTSREVDSLLFDNIINDITNENLNHNDN